MYLFGGLMWGSQKKTVYDVNITNGLVQNLGDLLPNYGAFNGAVSYGTHIYLFGQRSNGNYSKVYDFDTTTKSFITDHQTTMSVDAYYTSCSILGNKILVFGGEGSGFSSNLVQYFSVNSDYTLTSHNDVTVTCTNGAGYRSSCVSGGKYYVFGGKGYLGSSYYNTIETFSFSDDTVTKPDYTYTGSYTAIFGASIGAVDNHIYLFGGSTGSAYCDSIFDLDTGTNAISQLSVQLSIGKMGMSSAVAGRYVYLFGGSCSGGTYSKEVQIFDTSTKTIL